MKNTSKLLAVVLALTVALSGIVITTLTANAADKDTKVYAEYNGAQCHVNDLDDGWHNDHRKGDVLDIDYYEKDLYAPDTKNLEAGKVYKAIYIFTFQEVAEPTWEFKFMPTEEYYFNITNGDVWKSGETKTAVVVPFKVTNPDDVKLKTWQHGGMRNGSTLDKIMVVGADYNAYSAGDFDIVVEGVANAGSNVTNNKPADDEWTKSRKLDTNVYKTYNGAQCHVNDLDDGWHNDHRKGDVLDIDYYEKDLYAPETKDLEAGKVYKAIYIFTFQEVAEPTWEFKFMPTEEYYFNITNGDVWKSGETKTAVVVPFKVTNPDDVKLKTWQHGGMRNGSTLDKIMVVGADYNAYNAGDFDIVIENVANAGSNVTNNRPADDEWTPSSNSDSSSEPEEPVENVPTLDAAEGEVLAYINFSTEDMVNVIDAQNITPTNGVGIMNGDGYIEFDSSILEKFSDELIVEFVIKPQDVARDHRIIMSMGNVPDNANVMGFYHSGLKHTNQDSVSTSPIAVGEWIKVKYVLQEGNAKIYINDEERANGEETRYPNIGGPIKFGTWTVEAWQDPGFIGSVSEIRISTVTFTDDGDDEGDEGEEPEGPTYTDDIYFGVAATEWSDGLKVPDDPGNNTDGIGNTSNGSWFMIPYDFGTNSAVGIKINYCNNSNRCGSDAKVAIWVGGKSEEEGGTLLAVIDLAVTGDNWGAFGDVEAEFISSITGQCDVYFVLSADTSVNPYVANFNHFQFAVVAGSGEEPPVTGGDEEPPVTGGEEEPPVTGGDEDPVGPGPGKTGDVATPIAVMALLAVAAAGIVVLRKKEVNE